MTDEKANEAKDRASIAATQVKQAGRNAGRAAKAGAEATVDAVADEARDAADKAERTAEDAVEAARRVNVGVLGKMSSDTGVGFLALSVCIYSGAVAFAKFRQAASSRSRIIS